MTRVEIVTWAFVHGASTAAAGGHLGAGAFILDEVWKECAWIDGWLFWMVAAKGWPGDGE